MMAAAIESGGLAGLAAATVRYLDRRMRLDDASRHQFRPNTLDALDALRLSQHILAVVADDRGPTALAALRAGASWPRIGEAMGLTVSQARGLVESWIAEQVRLYQAQQGRAGMSPAAAAAARRLADQADQADRTRGGGEPR